jgi:hypothetical protein
MGSILGVYTRKSPKRCIHEGDFDHIVTLFWVYTINRVERKADYNILQFHEDEVFTNKTIYPGKVVPHDWKTLRTMWKAVNTD